MIDGDTTIFTVWRDGFFHASWIAGVFAGARLVHRVGYRDGPIGSAHLSLRELCGASGRFSIDGHRYPDQVFASFMLPVGVLLTGLAAFAFGMALWGAWPGLAAAAAVMLIPDAYQQGFENRYLSYNFLQQAAPAGLYGVALVAFAWVFVLDGCKRGRYSSISWVMRLPPFAAYKALYICRQCFPNNDLPLPVLCQCEPSQAPSRGLFVCRNLPLRRDCRNGSKAYPQFGSMQPPPLSTSATMCWPSTIGGRSKCCSADGSPRARATAWRNSESVPPCFLSPRWAFGAPRLR